MKWSEMTGFHKAAFFLCVLCLIAGLTLTILDAVDVLASIEILEDVIDCVFWLSAGIAFWKEKSPVPIVCFVMSGLRLICIFI